MSLPLGVLEVSVRSSRGKHAASVGLMDNGRQPSALDTKPDGRKCLAHVGKEGRVRFFAVLQTGPIESARDAVRASLLAERCR